MKLRYTHHVHQPTEYQSWTVSAFVWLGPCYLGRQPPTPHPQLHSKVKLKYTFEFVNPNSKIYSKTPIASLLNTFMCTAVRTYKYSHKYVQFNLEVPQDHPPRHQGVMGWGGGVWSSLPEAKRQQLNSLQPNPGLQRSLLNSVYPRSKHAWRDMFIKSCRAVITCQGSPGSDSSLLLSIFAPKSYTEMRSRRRTGWPRFFANF
jgi:hypothetical protein